MKKNNGRHAAMQFLVGTLTLAALVVGSALPAFADDTTTTQKTFTFNKEYLSVFPTGVEQTNFQNPAETFSFTAGDAPAEGTAEKVTTATNSATLAAVSQTSWNTSSIGTTDTNRVEELSSFSEATQKEIRAAVPNTITLSSVSYKSGESDYKTTATEKPGLKDVTGTITGSYGKPGVYYYDFHEFQGNTAGVSYNTDSYRIAVKVTVENGVNTVTEFKLINKTNTDAAKDSSIVNYYGAGKLTFTKTVSGNVGDKNKEFKVKVKLTAPTEPTKVVYSTIGVSGSNAPTENNFSSITADSWTEGKGTVEKTYYVKDGTTITLNNIPAGVKCLVKEESYASDGYETLYTLGDGQSPIATDNLAQTMIPGQSINLTIKNTRDTSIDTGIFTSNLPYFIILVVAVGGAVIFGISRRKRKV